MLRVLALIFGVPVLLMGLFGLGIDVYTAIEDHLNTDPHIRVITTFPFGTLYGTPCLWLGYRLLFTKRTKASLPDWVKDLISNRASDF